MALFAEIVQTFWGGRQGVARVHGRALQGFLDGGQEVALGNVRSLQGLLARRRPQPCRPEVD